MKLSYNKKTIKLIEGKTFFQRLKGFMFKKNIDYAIIFNKCNSIHTFFMKENIDVIMCDENNNIIHFYKNLKKNKIILQKKKVSKVIETPANYFNIVIPGKIIIEKTE